MSNEIKTYQFIGLLNMSIYLFYISNDYLLEYDSIYCIFMNDTTMAYPSSLIVKSSSIVESIVIAPESRIYISISDGMVIYCDINQPSNSGLIYRTYNQVSSIIAYNKWNNTMYLFDSTFIVYKYLELKGKDLINNWNEEFLTPFDDEEYTDCNPSTTVQRGHEIPKGAVVVSATLIYICTECFIISADINDRTFKIIAGTWGKVASEDYEIPYNKIVFHKLTSIAYSQFTDTIYVKDEKTNILWGLRDGIATNLNQRIFNANGRRITVKHSSNQANRIIIDYNGDILISNTDRILSINPVTLQIKLVVELEMITPYICCMGIDKLGNIYAGNIEGLFKVNRTWDQIRLIWLGHLKPTLISNTQSPLTILPKDIIKEICSYLRIS